MNPIIASLYGRKSVRAYTEQELSEEGGPDDPGRRRAQASRRAISSCIQSCASRIRS